MLKQTAAAALLALAAVLPAAPAGAAADPEITAEVRYFYPDLDFKYASSSIRVYENGLGSEISHTLDFVDNLGTEADNGPEVRVGIGENWQISYMKIDGYGWKKPEKFFEWHGNAYRGTTESSLKMQYLRLAYRKPWIKNERMKAYWMVDIKDIKLEAKARDLFSNTVDSREEHQAMPTIGVGVEGALDESGRWRGNAEVSYLPAGNYGHSYDAEAGLSYAVADRFTISAGYRVLKLKADKDDEQVDFRLKGPYFGVRGTF